METVQSTDYQYKMKFYFNDNSYLTTPLAYGVPPQTNPSYVPYASSPDINDYLKYRDRGYNYLQMLFANQILQQETGNPAAWINMMQQPLPTKTNVDDPFG